MDITKKMEYIHEVLETKHYFFTETADKGVLLRLEDDHACKYSFKGMTMVSAMTEALAYIKQEIKAGSLKDVDMTEEEATEKHKQEKTEQSSILNKLKRNKKNEKNNL